MKKLRSFARYTRQTYQLPYTDGKAWRNLIMWAVYFCFIAAMMVFNKVMDTASWFSFTSNLLCLIWGFTVTWWSIQGMRYRRYIRGYTAALDEAVKTLTHGEHGVTNLRMVRRPGEWIADCNCGCGGMICVHDESHELHIHAGEPAA